MLKTAPLLALLVTSALADLANIVPEDSKVTQLGTGMKFTEGPVWIPTEKRLVWSDIPNSRQMQWSEKDGTSEWRKVQASNGNLLDLQGNLLSCQHAGRNLISTNPEGKITILADTYKGKKLNSPNDLAVHSDGSIWFTDPTYGLGKTPSEIGSNNVYRLDPKTRELTVVRTDFDMPNGIAFSPDEKTIYITDTGKLGKIRAFKVPRSGPLVDQLFEIDIKSDGICIDTKGNIYTTAAEGVAIFNNKGKKLGTIKVPEHPANACFGGPENKTLFITARKSLYSIKLKTTGATAPTQP